MESYYTMQKYQGNKLQGILLRILREENNNSANFKEMSSDQWQDLVILAGKLDLVPILYTRLVNLRFIGFPSILLLRLQQAYLHNLKKSLLLEQKLIEILTYFKKKNIPVISLKGPVLTRLIYQNLTLRQASVDLDLLVPVDRVIEAEKRLADMGYFLCSSAEKTKFLHSHLKMVNLKKKDSELIIDLHWDFRDRFTRTHLNDFWQGAQNFDFEEYRALVPSLEDLLLHLVLVTMSAFNFVKLKYLFDMHCLIEKNSNRINWILVSQKAKIIGAQTAFYFNLRLLQELLDTRIPMEVIAAVRPGFFKERLLRFWINGKNVLELQPKIANSILWRKFTSSYLYSNNILEFIVTILKKIFVPLEEISVRNEGLPLWQLYWKYVRRLLKPFLSLEKL